VRGEAETEIQLENPWLVVDCNYVCTRLYHRFRPTEEAEVPYLVAGGFFDEIVRVADLFGTRRVVFCFDSTHSIRRQIWPQYKSNRRERMSRMEPGERRCYLAMLRFVLRLRRRVLPWLGFRNVFCAGGYEADDVIAKLVRGPARPAVVLAGDNDLFQLLDDEVVVFDPRKNKVMDFERFEREVGVPVGCWYRVKAIAGDSSDGIPGVPGVGIKRAISFVMGTIDPDGKWWRIIMDHQEEVRLFERLVKLPLEGCPRFLLRSDEVEKSRWRRLMAKLGARGVVW